MAQKILVTGNLPKEVMDLLNKRYEVEIQSEDRPMERQAFLFSQQGDRLPQTLQSLLSMNLRDFYPYRTGLCFCQPVACS